ncbi:MFS transporter [Actinomycetospora sp. NBRC 106378]|uniref:MFS transporter n=1 Tax=Actinomycetospora sp. NBRC 106378 TaxID=3032208 RepID=UPI0024A4D41C|nr:MFS transporter [Actinomycetospora sp. NBRC 106378]GLZ51967.1 MFS transporter [Actinomycetospora sp. NBRC 106378]
MRSEDRTRARLFAAVGGIVVLFPAASSVPSPLYPLYQQLFGFSAATLTIVFAVYVLGLLGALLVVGALSDHVGRRPVLAGAIALEAISFVVFLTAGGVPALLVARVLQGIATGAAITTLGATMVDLAPREAPHRAGMVTGVGTLAGLAAGAVGAGALIQLAPAPTRLVWIVLLALLVLSAVIVAVLPETATRRTGVWASLVPRVGVAPRLRGEVLAVTPVLVTSWALGGLYMSLGPSIAATLLGVGSRLVGGLVVTLLCGTGALASYLLRDRPVRGLVAPAAGLLAVGTTVTLAGMALTSVLVAGLGTVVAGIGFGAAALACFGVFAEIAEPGERGELFAVAYVISYTAFSVPAVVAGIGSGIVGLATAAEVYGGVVVVLGAAAVAINLVHARRRRPALTTAA